MLGTLLAFQLAALVAVTKGDQRGWLTLIAVPLVFLPLEALASYFLGRV
jgi:hypothetical protein